jgi:hypothetical protein
MSTPSFWDHPIATIEKALHIRKQIEALKSSLSSILGGVEVGHGKMGPKRRGRPPKATSVESPGAKADGRKGKRSAATRAKMAAAAKARWAAKSNDVSTTAADAPSVKAPKKKRHTMSPEARERIAAAQRARWAKVKR